MLINLNGTIVTDPADAHVSVLDRGFLFGDSVYETIRTVGGRLFTADEHLARLERSAARIGLPLPLDRDGWVAAFERTRAAGPAALREGECLLRIVVTRGETASLDLAASSDPRPFYVLFIKPLPDWGASSYEEGTSVAVVEVIRNDRLSLDPAIKSGNYLNNVLAYREAHAAGAREALMFNLAGELTEAPTSNVFIVRGGVVMTPPVASGLLPGVTRELVLTLARGLGYDTVDSAAITRPMLDTADEVFLTSSTRDVMPVTRLNGTAVGDGLPGPVTRSLAHAYEQMLEEFRRAAV